MTQSNRCPNCGTEPIIKGNYCANCGLFLGIVSSEILNQGFLVFRYWDGTYVPVTKMFPNRDPALHAHNMSRAAVFSDVYVLAEVRWQDPNWFLLRFKPSFRVLGWWPLKWTSVYWVPTRQATEGYPNAIPVNFLQ